MPRHVSWKYRFPRKFWESTREILRGTTRVHACKNEVIIERYCRIILYVEVKSFQLTILILLLPLAVFIAQLRVHIACMLPFQSLRNGQSYTKIFEYKFKLLLIHYSSHKQTLSIPHTHKHEKLNYSLLRTVYTLNLFNVSLVTLLGKNKKIYRNNYYIHTHSH